MANMEAPTDTKLRQKKRRENIGASEKPSAEPQRPVKEKKQGKTFEKLWQRKKRGMMQLQKTAFTAVRTSCFWPINDRFRKILNQEPLLDELVELHPQG